MIIPGQFGFNCSCGFREEAFLNTTGPIRTKLSRNVPWMVLYKVTVFRSSWIFNMAARANNMLWLAEISKICDDRINCNFLALSYSLNLRQIPFISLYSIFLKVWLFLHLKKKWNSSSISFKSQNLQNSKIYIYSKIKTEYEMNNYILNINYEDRNLLCKMQVSNHFLEIERGRYNQKIILHICFSCCLISLLNEEFLWELLLSCIIFYINIIKFAYVFYIWKPWVSTNWMQWFWERKGIH
jgi:hypothetical protein